MNAAIAVDDGKAEADCDVTTKLNIDCWEMVFTYLEPMEQVQLSKANDYIHQIFQNYASRRFKNISPSLKKRFTPEIFDDFLQNIGVHVRSYAIPRDITDIYARSEYFEDKDYEKQINDLIRFKMYRCQYGRINLEMRHNYSIRRDFEVVVKHCKYLESFEFGERCLTPSVPYEVICQLPKLQHLFIWTAGPLRNEFLDALQSKPGAPMLSLSIKGLPLPKQQIERICDVASLKQLCVCCDTVPKKALLKLHQLESLHLTMPSINNDQLFKLVKGLPHLHTLNLRNCSLITEQFVLDTRDWMTTNLELRQKLKIYMQGSAINWESLDTSNKNVVEVINKEETEIVPLQGELNQAYL